MQKEAYLTELSRYVVLNPVRAGMVARPEDWPWSSYRARLGDVPCPPWLLRDWLLAAYPSGGYTLKEIGAFFGLHYAQVSRIA